MVLVTKITQESVQYGLDLNISKTKFMVISNNAVAAGRITIIVLQQIKRVIVTTPILELPLTISTSTHRKFDYLKNEKVKSF